MTDHPIIFSAPMVRALIEGRKTMTRRLATSPLRKVNVGDRLWVRESFREHPTEVVYFADDMNAPGRIRPSIHMPRAISRLTLVITAFKVEPLQAISHDDALAEGVEPNLNIGFGVRGPMGGWLGTMFATAPEAFSFLWMSLHGAASWSANPEVVALSFWVEKINIDEMKS